MYVSVSHLKDIRFPPTSTSGHKDQLWGSWTHVLGGPSNKRQGPHAGVAAAAAADAGVAAAAAAATSLTSLDINSILAISSSTGSEI